MSRLLASPALRGRRGSAARPMAPRRARAPETAPLRGRGRGAPRRRCSPDDGASAGPDDANNEDSVTDDDESVGVDGSGLGGDLLASLRARKAELDNARKERWRGGRCAARVAAAPGDWVRRLDMVRPTRAAEAAVARGASLAPLLTCLVVSTNQRAWQSDFTPTLGFVAPHGGAYSALRPAGDNFGPRARNPGMRAWLPRRRVLGRLYSSRGTELRFRRRQGCVLFGKGVWGWRRSQSRFQKGGHESF